MQAAEYVAQDAGQVVVVGGGDLGCEVAHFLVLELAGGEESCVTVVEMLPHFMTGNCTTDRGFLIYHMERAGCELWNCSRLLRVKPGAVLSARNVSPTVPSPYVTWTPVPPENVGNLLARPTWVEEREVRLDAGLVVLATGMAPDPSLYEAGLREQVAPEVHDTGDALAPATVAEAVKAGHAIGGLL
jgi:2-enoate reductase